MTTLHQGTAQVSGPKIAQMYFPLPCVQIQTFWTVYAVYWFVCERETDKAITHDTYCRIINQLLKVIHKIFMNRVLSDILLKDKI